MSFQWSFTTEAPSIYCSELYGYLHINNSARKEFFNFSLVVYLALEHQSYTPLSCVVVCSGNSGVSL